MNLTEDIQRGTQSSSTGAPQSPDDPRVVRAMEEYSAALKAGQKPDRHEFEARYPEVAASLAECLEGLEFVQAVAPLLQPPAGDQPAAHSPAAAEFCPEGPLGDYRILREIGRGGMGVVYEAVQISLGRQVALKVLPFAAALDAKQLQRFKNEAQAAAHLHHQNIVPVYGVGCERGVHYYAMQFIDGQNLAAMIAQLRPLAGLAREDREAPTTVAGTLAGELASGRWAPLQRSRDDSQLTGLFTPIPTAPAAVAAADSTTRPMAGISTEHSTRTPAFFRTVANLGVQAAEALEYAHSVGVTHRDIKPANLLVDMRGNLWITDFGLSHFQSQAGLTMTGDLVGTLRYMSPEQALAQRAVIDHRTDVYSLGATLYELLTLEPVFDGRDRLELLRQIAFEEPKSPRRLDKAIPAELETIVLKALEKNPIDRYATAQELADDLGRFLNDESIRASPPSLLQRARKWSRRHQELVRTAVVAMALLLLTVAVGASLALWRLNDEQKATRDQLHIAEQAKRQATQRLYDARLAQAKAGRLSGRPGQRFTSLKAIEDAVQIAREMRFPDERLDALRNEAMACLSLPDLRLGRSWSARAPGIGHLAFDGDYQRYARASEQGSISVRRVADDTEITCLDGFGQPVQALLFSPDGQFLAVHAKDGRMQVWQVERGLAILPESSPGHSWDFSRDSKQIAIARPDGSIDLHDLATGKETRRLRGPSARPVVAFAPDGRRLAVIYEATSAPVQVWDLASGSVVSEWSVVPATRIWNLAWAPDGQRLALGLGIPANRAEVWNVAARRRVATMDGHGQDVTILSFHPGGNLLATGSWDGTVRLWEAASGRPVLIWTGDYNSLRFSRDGNLLGHISFPGQASPARFMEVAAGQEYRTLVSSLGAGQGDYIDGDISPDGRLLALGMADGGDRVWDLSSGRELAVLPSGSVGVLFQPSGRELLTCGATGLHRWPIQESQEAASEFSLGPARKIALPVVPHRAARSPDGDTLAIISERSGTGLLMDLKAESVDGQRLAHQGASEIALSPDGRWVASSGWHSDRVRLWNARTGKMVHEWVLGPMMYIYFTPDSRALIICRADAFTFWNVDTLEPIRRLGREVSPYPGRVAFSQDGRLMALEMAPAVIHLKEVATGRTVARLEDPHGDRAGWMGFTPDGTQLVVAALYAKAIHIWDLRAIRQRLKAMGLDWDWEEFPPAQPRANAARLATVDVLLGDLTDPVLWCNRASVHANLGQHDKAVADYSKAIELKADHAPAWYARAWLYVAKGQWAKSAADLAQVCKLYPDDLEHIFDYAGALLLAGDTEGYERVCAHLLDSGDKLRSADLPGRRSYLIARILVLRRAAGDDLVRTARLANEAVTAQPSAWSLHTLGLAHYRSGRYDEAVREIQHSLRVGPNWAALPVNWLVLALAHYRLGHTAEARQWLSKAVETIDKDPRGTSVPAGTNPGLHAHDWLAWLLLRREAEALLKKEPEVRNQKSGGNRSPWSGLKGPFRQPRASPTPASGLGW